MGVREAGGLLGLNPLKSLTTTILGRENGAGEWRRVGSRSYYF